MTYGGDVVVAADSLCKQPVTDLPGEDGRTLSLVLRDLGDHLGRGDPGLGATDGSRPDGSGLVVPTVRQTGRSVEDMTNYCVVDI